MNDSEDGEVSNLMQLKYTWCIQEVNISYKTAWKYSRIDYIIMASCTITIEHNQEPITKSSNGQNMRQNIREYTIL